MRNKTMAVLLALLFLIFLAPASAMTFGEARVNTTLVVSGLPQGAIVQFILNGGVPVFVVADANGTARYMPLLEGTLDIVVRQNDVVIERKSTTVLPEIVASITGFTLDSSGTRGKWINASVNVTNNDSVMHWFVIDVSGVNAADGYPLVATATVRLDAGETLNNIPVLITVPPGASTGTYSLTAGIWKLEDFADPEKLITTKGPQTVTIS